MQNNDIRKAEITRQKVRTKHISCAMQRNKLYVEFYFNTTFYDLPKVLI